MRRTVFLLAVLLISGTLSAQTHTAVTVDNPVYDFIDTMVIRGILDRDTMVRPWPRSKVLSALSTIGESSEDLRKGEAEYLEYLIDQIDTSIKKKIFEQGAVDIPSDLFPAQFGFRWDNEVRTGISSDMSFSALSFLEFYLQGDVPGPISYNFQVSPGLISLIGGFDSYEPYTYTKRWDGSPFRLIGSSSYGFPSELSGNLEVTGEIALSAWDDRFWTRFARLRRDWGTFGSGNLFLASTARPFTAYELTFNPWKWFSFSALTGSLDYGIGIWNEYGTYPVPGSGVAPEDADPLYSSAKKAALVEQNSYSIIQAEFMPTRHFYVSIFDAVVWPKRYELDYIFPFQSKFFGQEVVGDFDNMMIGGSLAFLAPGYGQAWMSFYIDEMDLLSDDFFELDRNMYAYQLGTTIPIPLFAMGKIRLQYTKIEPYTYTHPPVNSPTYGDVDDDDDMYDMQTYYLNNGEALGFYQPPNSDELRLEITTMPVPGLKTGFKYRMIRHGAIHGQYRVDGSSYYDYIDYYRYSGAESSWKDDPLYRKDFLKDGAYQWQHVWGLSADWHGDIWNIPFRLGLSYDFVWSYYTNWDVSRFQIYEDADYQSSINNIVTLYFSIYP